MAGVRRTSSLGSMMGQLRRGSAGSSTAAWADAERMAELRRTSSSAASSGVRRTARVRIAPKPEVSSRAQTESASASSCMHSPAATSRMTLGLADMCLRPDGMCSYTVAEMKFRHCFETVGPTRASDFNTLQPALGCLSSQSCFRRSIIRLVDSVSFDRTVLLLVILNSLTLALGSEAEHSATVSSVLDVLEQVFFVAFIVEAALKIIARGMYAHNGAYLRNSWNVLDFCIVLASLANFLVGTVGGGESGNVSALRTLRILRPLRTISKIPKLQALVSTLLKSVPTMAGICVLLMFACWVFAILGLQLFNGALNYSCFLVPPNTTWDKVDSFSLDSCSASEGASAAAWLPLLAPTASPAQGAAPTSAPSQLASPTASPQTSSPASGRPWAVCNDTQVCGTGSVFGVHTCGMCGDMRQQCLEHDTLTSGVLSFNHIGHALLLVFKIASLDDWPFDQERFQAHYGHHVWMFFFIVTLLGNYFIFNLVLAVLAAQFSEHAPADDDADDAEREPRKVTPANMLGASFAHPCMTWALLGQAGSYDGESDVSDLSYLSPVSRLADAIPRAETEGSDSDDSDGDDGEEPHACCCIPAAPPGCASKVFAPLPPEDQMSKLRVVLVKIVRSLPFNLTVYLLTFANVVVLAADHHRPPTWMEQTIEMTNFVCSLGFAAEAVVKLAALRGSYFLDSINCFDLSLVVLSIPDFFVSSTGGLNALRVGRVIRMTKFLRFQSLRGLRQVMRTALSAMRSVVWFTFLLLMFIFIFATLGQQLFSTRFEGGRLTFLNFYESVVSVFVLITGEGWATEMKFAMEGFSSGACAYYIVLFFVGNCIFLNLQIAVLCDAYAGAETKEIVRRDSARAQSYTEGDTDMFLGEEKRPVKGDSFGCLAPESSVRVKLASLVRHRFFDGFVTVLIILNAAMIAIDSPQMREDNPSMFAVLDWADVGFAALFISEAVTKMIVYGVCCESAYAYMQDGWNVADLFVAIIALISIFVKSLRALRSLRTIRLLTRIPGPKLMINCLRVALPQAGHTLIVLVVFMFVWAVAGVQLFKGFLYQCSDTSVIEEEDCHGTFTPHTTGCFGNASMPTEERVWKRLPNSFDNVGLAMLALFEMVIGDGWADIMFALVDARGVGRGPSDPDDRGFIQWFRSMYSLIFMVIGQFLIINLCVGILIDKFLEERMEQEGGGMLTDTQSMWLAAQKYLLAEPPGPLVPEATNPLRSLCRKITLGTWNKFELNVTSPWQTAGSLGSGHEFTPDVAEEGCQPFVDSARTFRNLPQVCIGAPMVRGRMGMAPHTVLTVSTSAPADVYVFVAPHLNASTLSRADRLQRELKDAERHGGATEPMVTSFAFSPDGFLASAQRAKLASKWSVILPLAGWTELRDTCVRFFDPALARDSLNARVFKQRIEKKRFGSWIWGRKGGTTALPPTDPHAVFTFVAVPLDAPNPFDMFIIACIVLNAVLMSMRHRGQSQDFTDMLELANVVFVCIFAVEACIKMVGLWPGPYFSDPWNRFDFLVVVASLVALTGVGGVALGVLRLFRVGRLLRILGRGHLNQLFSALVGSLPAVANVALLLLVIFFVFASVGVELFGLVPGGAEGITENTNFKNVYYAIVTLYTISTTEGWASVQRAAWNQPSGCEDDRTCGASEPVTRAYFMLFMLVGGVLVMNLFAAAVIDGYNTILGGEEDLASVDLACRGLWREWQKRDVTGKGWMYARDAVDMIRYLGRPLTARSNNPGRRRIRARGPPTDFVTLMNTLAPLPLRVRGKTGKKKVSFNSVASCLIMRLFSLRALEAVFASRVGGVHRLPLVQGSFPAGQELPASLAKFAAVQKVESWMRSGFKGVPSEGMQWLTNVARRLSRFPTMPSPRPALSLPQERSEEPAGGLMTARTAGASELHELTPTQRALMSNPAAAESVCTTTGVVGLDSVTLSDTAHDDDTPESDLTSSSDGSGYGPRGAGDPWMSLDRSSRRGPPPPSPSVGRYAPDVDATSPGRWEHSPQRTARRGRVPSTLRDAVFPGRPSRRDLYSDALPFSDSATALSAYPESSHWVTSPPRHQGRATAPFGDEHGSRGDSWT
eukprot:TRINITY_DN9133_c0_g2_i1.p1 TRINITY_DN9133_c0_g2~~TRINITY_DN9133_c0_g2_i1.p1  ORF type:complete len:2103 (+),score=593.84 TRINITY_DN9133_c0_g2_i1:101-6310(+)